MPYRDNDDLTALEHRVARLEQDREVEERRRVRRLTKAQKDVLGRVRHNSGAVLVLSACLLVIGYIVGKASDTPQEVRVFTLVGATALIILSTLAMLWAWLREWNSEGD